jgi:hypothetical protein
MAPTSEPAEPHAVPSSWGRRYVVETHLGTAGALSVFAARDAALRRPVILVVQEGDAEERAAFLERARLLARHDLDHAVELFDCAVGDERAVVVTERPVASFAEVVASSSLTSARRRSIAVALGGALASFHRAGIDPVGLSPHTVGFDEGGDLRVSAWPVTSFSATGPGTEDDRAALAAMVGSLGTTPAWRRQLVDSAVAAYEGVGEPAPVSPVPVTAPVPVVGSARAGDPPTAQLQRVGAVAPPPPPSAPARRVHRRAALGVAAAVAVLAMATGGALAASRHHAPAVQVRATPPPKPAPLHATTTTTSTPPPQATPQPVTAVAVQAPAPTTTTTTADAPTTSTTMAPTTTTSTTSTTVPASGGTSNSDATSGAAGATTTTTPG